MMGPLLAATLALGGAGPSVDLGDGVRLSLSGYLDVGFFDVGGDGVAYDRAVGREGFAADYPDAAKVYYGDPWANMINSEGHSADLGLDRSHLVADHDAVASGGHPTFLVNTLNQGLLLSRGKHLAMHTSVDVHPRTGSGGGLGDTLEVDRAYVWLRPIRGSDLALWIGKAESAFGMEYRNRTAPDRLGVSPSLISRYTTGRPTGIKARGSHRQVLWYAFALTNGGTVDERFGHLSDELDSNGPPTASGRLGVRVEGPVRVESGVSGLVGPQDAQPDADVRATQLGVDLRVEVRNFVVSAEGMWAEHQGGGSTAADSLDVLGGYVEASYQPLGWLAPVMRVDHRDADLWLGPHVYVSDEIRLTGALRFDLSSTLIAKLEVQHTMELEREGLAIPADVFTSSLVFRF